MITSLLIWIIVFAILAYVINWVCVRFDVPRPVFWLIGLILLLILLNRIAEISGFHLP